MTPNEPDPPETVSPAASEQPPVSDFGPPPPPSQSYPFWDYSDLAFVISLCFPALLLSAFLVKILSGVLPSGKPFQGLLAQFIWYAIVFGSLYGLLRVRYQHPFWRSLGWKIGAPGTTASFLAGPLLAISVGYLGYILRAPEIHLPFQQMLEDRATLILFAIFVIVLGPLCEELAFRGFLMPLLMRSFGAALGIVLTGVLFGCLHGYEYSWSWRHMLLITIAGTVFGWVRYRTGSTAASAFMHGTYNLTQFAAFLAQNTTR